MKIFYDPAFLEKLKKVDVRIRKSVKATILIFYKDPNYPELNNHPLKRNYTGYRSIDITADYRAIYKEIQQDDGLAAYFVLLGTHTELYG